MGVDICSICDALWAWCPHSLEESRAGVSDIPPYPEDREGEEGPLTEEEAVLAAYWDKRWEQGREFRLLHAGA